MKDDLAATRSKARDFFTTIFGEDLLLATKLETVIFNWTLAQFSPNVRFWENPSLRNIYSQKVLQLKFNLSLKDNPTLKNKVVSGEISMPKLVQMHPYDLFPERWEDVFLQVAKKRLKKELTEDVNTMPDGAFVCRHCKSKKTSYTQLQTRSADEPLTTFVECHGCGKHWKM